MNFLEKVQFNKIEEICFHGGKKIFFGSEYALENEN